MKGPFYCHGLRFILQANPKKTSTLTHSSCQRGLSKMKGRDLPYTPCSFPNTSGLREHKRRTLWRMHLLSSTAPDSSTAQRALTLRGSNTAWGDGRSQPELLVALTIHHAHVVTEMLSHLS